MKAETKIKTRGMFFLWAGAAISLAEIMTGGLIAPLGFWKGVAVVLVGHLIGCLILAFTGLIGYRKGTSALESSRLAFGRYGSYLISVLNILQLVGWTAVMLIQCADSVAAVTGLTGRTAFTVFVFLLGTLVAMWVLFVNRGFQQINSAAVLLLFALCIVIAVMILRSHGDGAKLPNTVSIGSALEFSIVMPLSWLPLISDYTMNADSKTSAVAGSFFGYFFGSSLMYVIGLAAVLFTNAQGITGVILQLGLGAAGLVVVVLATVTTTYLDVYSAVMSTLNLAPKAPKRFLILAVTAVGTVAAIFFPMGKYQSFLYAIGSVFAPVFSIVLADYFFLKKDRSASAFNWAALLCAAAGTSAYYFFLGLDSPAGSTIPSMLITSLLYLGVNALIHGLHNKSKQPELRRKEGSQ